MRRLGWAVVVLAIVGSLGYSAAVLLAVEFGGFFLRLFLRDVPDRSAPAIYLDILIHECGSPCWRQPFSPAYFG